MKFSKKDLNRIENTRRNAQATSLSMIITGVLSFLERMVFIRSLSAEYLGITGLFTNIISVLSFAELGLSGAIAYALYEPLEYKNHAQIIALMRFFRKAYRLIGIGIFLLGLCVIPFLPSLIKLNNVPHVTAYFMIYLVGTALTYFCSYKLTLFEADQKQYVNTIGENIGWSLQYLLQMAIVFFTRNYFLYLMVMVVINLSKFLIISHLATKSYPFLKEKQREKINPTLLLKVKKNVGGLIVNKLGNIAVTSTDNILISALIGIAILGSYSNYQMIILGVENFLWIFPSSLIASVGNLAISADKDKLQNTFQSLYFCSYLLYGTATILLFVISDPLVSLCFGQQYVFPFSTTLLLCLNFYLKGMRAMLAAFRASLGLYWSDRYRPLVEAGLNLGISIFLAQFWGLNGIIMGTTISTLATGFWIEPHVIYHDGFTKHSRWFFLDYAFYTFITIINAGLCYFACKLIHLGGLLDLICQTLTTITISSLTFYVVFGKTKYMKQIIDTLKIVIRKKHTKDAQ